MSSRVFILIRNLVLTVVYAYLGVHFQNKGNSEAAGMALAAIGSIWIHSGRDKRTPGAGLSVLVPMTAALTLLGACDAQGPRWAFHWPGEGSPREERLSIVGYGPTAGLLADVVELKPAAAPTCTVGRACMYALNSDGLLYTKDANEITLKLHAAQSYRTSASCAGLSAPANGDVCYDTGLGVFRYYSAGWTTGPTSDSLLMHLAGTETATGNKTFSGTTTFSGNVAMSTTKTLTVGANVLIGSVADKLNAAYLAIASQAIGDLLVADSTTTFARKAKGTDGQYLGMVSGAVAWATYPFSTVSGGGTGALGAATVYLTAPGQAPSATERYLTLATRAANSRNLYCYLGTAPGGGDTVAVTVRENAADGALTCTITGAATTCNDASNAIASVAGDRLSVKAVSSAGTAADITCTFELTAG